MGRTAYTWFMADSERPRPVAFERFEELARRLIHVPKKEVDKKEAEREKRNGKKAS